MTKSEAIEALANGKKLTHTYFTLDEWVEQLATGKYRFEDGNICSPSSFWQYRTDKAWEDGWYEWVSVS